MSRIAAATVLADLSVIAARRVRRVKASVYTKTYLFPAPDVLSGQNRSTCTRLFGCEGMGGGAIGAARDVRLCGDAPQTMHSFMCSRMSASMEGHHMIWRNLSVVRNTPPWPAMTLLCASRKRNGVLQRVSENQ